MSAKYKNENNLEKIHSGVVIEECTDNDTNELNENIAHNTKETNNASETTTATSPTTPSADPTNIKERKDSITNESISSNNISIVTLDDNDNESSIVDSDSDVDDAINCNEIELRPGSSGIVLVNKSFEQQTNASGSQSSILCANNSESRQPNIGSIAVQNSSDITFGNKTFYQGPVTIKQFLYDKNKWKATTDTNEGNENPTFVNSTTDDLHDKTNIDTVFKDHPDENKKKWKWTNKQALFITIAASTVVSLILIVVLVMRTGENENGVSSTKKIGDGDDSRLNIPINSTIGSDIISDTAGPLRIVTRGEWIAQPPSSELTDLVLPSTRVIIAHTATEDCQTQAACTFRVRTIQTYHIESRGWDDIGYNFLVGGDGAVYVGRGWNKQGAHTKGYNVKSICIAFIGTFNKVVPPKRQLYAAQKIIEEGVKLKKLDEHYRLYGHRQLMASESPGAALFEIIKTWDHWSEEIVPI